MNDSLIIGLDIGSVTVGLVTVTPNRQIVDTHYAYHRGDIVGCLKRQLEAVPLSHVTAVVATHSTPSNIKAQQRYDHRVAVITAARRFHDAFGAILIVGGERFGLIRFDSLGNYSDYRANTSCAAGTGSFLDQQARRLQLEDIAKFCRLAAGNTGSIPKIATRCAVFAKTDLVHAQQEGYCLAEICDGLCYGLARNVLDTVLAGETLHGPIVFCGGVSRNTAVVRHLQNMLGKELIVERSLYGAAGAAYAWLDEIDAGRQLEPLPELHSAEDVFARATKPKAYHFPPLALTRSSYPDFDRTERYEFGGGAPAFAHPVEVERYANLTAGAHYRVYLGFDIGSTSTKAVLHDKRNQVLAGFYTRTSGRPLMATQAILAAVADLIDTRDITLDILGVGTTGSGRKFVGKIIGADLVIDEITAHARAACHLNPKVDTIIEIGGQDSKFTTLRNGIVTLSIMNTVCAAGTGSFIEEQAEKLGCPLGEISARAENRRSPIASNRCTVFMERDINHCLSEGFGVDEVLASALHAVCENYLTKVAVESHIGEVVLFQGATAKIRALVAAFEQRLQKPVEVSTYCHLTGALGTALMLAEQRPRANTAFRGLDLHRKPIATRSETCRLCSNHCKITLAELDGETVAYGFLCGRDYGVKRRRNRYVSGFDLLNSRRKAAVYRSDQPIRSEITVGIPAALHLYEDLNLWRYFFRCLGISTVTSEGHKDALKTGKQLARAEFCAPVAALHGHLKYLLDGAEVGRRVDAVFLPFYFERKSEEKGLRRQFCYYTQFAPTLCTAIDRIGPHNSFTRHGGRVLTPLINYLYGHLHTKVQLHKMLKQLDGPSFSFFEVAAAYEKALAYRQQVQIRLKEIYRRAQCRSNDIHVILLGRPYAVLSRLMNKGIPDIFASLGIKVFYQDMLSYSAEDTSEIQPLLKECHWLYASRILEATAAVAKRSGAYPVLMTSFKCSPDSFVVEYFKRILDAHAKPYLILQLDEHGSAVGYETRIEAAVRSFHNHHRRQTLPAASPPVHSWSPVTHREISDKTILLPNWDHLSMRLVAACLRNEGVDARLLEESPDQIQYSLRQNTGQCLPLNIVAQEYIDYIERHDLDPARTALWMTASSIPCNLPLFPQHIRTLLDAYGRGMETAGIYIGSLSFSELSRRMPLNIYFAHMFGGLIRKVGCRLRPYEVAKGTTDRVIEQTMGMLEDAFLHRRSLEGALGQAIEAFDDVQRLERNDRQRPKVAVFGDLYVRDNQVFNQGLIRFIETHGGEVITTPYSSLIKMIAKPYLRKWLIERDFVHAVKSKALLVAISRLEKTYYPYFQRILREPDPQYEDSSQKILNEYHLRIEHTGESMENVLKIYYVMKYHPDVALFVQASPAFCCPSVVTEAMAAEIEKKTGVPIVSITYDGTGGNKNETIIPYLKFCAGRSSVHYSRTG